MVDLQNYKQGMSVHVDYSKDMHQELTEEFLQINNVKLLVQLEDDVGRALVLNRARTTQDWKQVSSLRELAEHCYQQLLTSSNQQS